MKVDREELLEVLICRLDGELRNQFALACAARARMHWHIAAARVELVAVGRCKDERVTLHAAQDACKAAMKAADEANGIGAGGALEAARYARRAAAEANKARVAWAKAAEWGAGKEAVWQMAMLKALLPEGTVEQYSQAAEAVDYD